MIQVLTSHQGKGYPDLNTRRFIRQASDYFVTQGHLSLPIFCLTDCDPDGLAILRTYKYGSIALAHENADTVLPSLTSVGVTSSILSEKCLDDGALMAMTARDRAKARKMLEDEVFEEDGSEPAWRIELHRIIMWNVKAEIQILDQRPGLLRKYLDAQIGEQM